MARAGSCKRARRQQGVPKGWGRDGVAVMWIFPPSQQSSRCTFRDGGSLTPPLASAASPKIWLSLSPGGDAVSGALSHTLGWKKEISGDGNLFVTPPSPINFQAHVALPVLQPTQTSGKAKPKHAPGGQSLQTPRVNTLRCGLQYPLAKTQSKGHW